MALTSLGYKKSTYQDILQNMIELCKKFFGEDIDTTDLTPLGKFIRIIAYKQAETEEEAELIYYSIFPNTATGTSLDRLLKFAGISRNPATVSQFTVKFTGDAGTIIPYYFEVGTESGLKFYTFDEYEIGEPQEGKEHGTCLATVYCDTKGTIGNIEASDINVIINPENGVASVEGVERIVDGTDQEDDVALRKRFIAALAGAGNCNELAIASALVRIESVINASVIENNSDKTDEAGRPPHSFECYISGGADKEEEIAKTIFDKKPVGIKTHGKKSVTFKDDGGNERTIKFSYTTPVYTTVNLSLKVNTTFDMNTGKDDIKKLLTDYINELGVGNSVILSSLYAIIHSVTGVVEVTDLKLSADGKVCNPNVEILITESATCKEINIAEVVVI